MKLKDIVQEASFKTFQDALGPQHQEAQEKKAAEYRARFDTGAPAQIDLPVLLRISAVTGEPVIEKRKFTIDNYLRIHRILGDVMLQDLGAVERDPAKRSAQPSYAIKRSPKHPEGSIPAVLFGLPAKTRKKPGYTPEDLRREAYDA